MVKALDIIGTCDRLLQPQAFADFGPNGLQVRGRQRIQRIATGVSATRALLVKAVELEADLVLVHHGLFWDGAQTGLSPVLQERLRVIFANDLNLAAYHLPLDGHPEHGNNAILAKRLGCDVVESFTDVGRAGTFAGDGIPVEDLHARIARVTDREPLRQGAGPERVRRIAIVSGSAASMLAQAVEEGFDAFLTGEPRESVMGEAEECGIHFFAAGHYATETFGIRRLGEIIAAEHGVEHVFVDLPNPV